MNYIIPNINSSQFFFSRWNAGSLIDLGVYTRTVDILEKCNILKKFAVGWCDGSLVPCRPKSETIAVMFYKNEEYFWTHLTKEEFEKTFKK
jgi:hypothetical protein